MKKIIIVVFIITFSGFAHAQGGFWVTYRPPGDDLYRIVPDGQSSPENVSTDLDVFSTGADTWLNISPNGQWFVLETERFDPDCIGWACLAVVKADYSEGAAIKVAGNVIHPEGFSAIASTGDLVIYPADGPVHSPDIWAVSREAGVWETPVNLSVSSPYLWNYAPAISDDGSHVVFDCGDEPYGVVGTSICEVATDGSGLRVVEDPGVATGLVALHSPDYDPDGNIVFEGDDGGENIWRIPGGIGTPVKITSDYNNDNSPCVLADGRIASLWLDRPGSTGAHELKVMSGDGGTFEMLVVDIDVFDIGLGCGGSEATPIFTDGFEAGDTTAWSSSVGE